MTLSRRALLGRSLALGCSAAASPLVTPVTFAAAPGDARLVVIVLRGALADIPGTHTRTAFAVGCEKLLLLSGDAEFSSWSPDSALNLSPQAELLLNVIYESDPLFQKAAMQAMELSDLTDNRGMSTRRGARAEALASFAAARLTEDSRIAAFSLNGWDTHANQANALPRALTELRVAIETLKSGLGGNWEKTLVLGLTEFGRTVRENGSRGTDHGTGGAAIFAGGALNGKRVFADWPGLGKHELYRDRDLMPTADVRAYAGWALRGLFGLSASKIERDVFPGLDLGRDPGFLA